MSHIKSNSKQTNKQRVGVMVHHNARGVVPLTAEEELHHGGQTLAPTWVAQTQVTTWPMPTSNCYYKLQNCRYSLKADTT